MILGIGLRWLLQFASDPSFPVPLGLRAAGKDTKLSSYSGIIHLETTMALSTFLFCLYANQFLSVVAHVAAMIVWRV